jgi:hypothetical protein
MEGNMPYEVALINSNKVALIDEEDADLIKGYAWWEHAASPTLSYAYGIKLPRQRSGERIVKMHRLILGVKSTKNIIDHVDDNGLNNCKSNLQIITTAQNQQKSRYNPDNIPRKKHTKFRGVSYLGWHGKYLAYINCNGKREFLGYYNTAEEAAKVRDKRAKELHGKFARLNYEDT